MRQYANPSTHNASTPHVVADVLRHGPGHLRHLSQLPQVTFGLPGGQVAVELNATDSAGIWHDTDLFGQKAPKPLLLLTIRSGPQAPEGCFTQGRFHDP